MKPRFVAMGEPAFEGSDLLWRVAQLAKRRRLRPNRLLHHWANRDLRTGCLNSQALLRPRQVLSPTAWVDKDGSLFRENSGRIIVCGLRHR